VVTGILLAALRRHQLLSFRYNLAPHYRCC
jgi:hypothetical protein